jgi:hypothetical protein
VTVTGSIAATSLSVTTLSFTGQLLAADGTVALPAYSYTSDPDTGIYRSAGDVISFATGGVESARLGGGRWYVGDGLVASPSLSFIADSNTGIYRSGTDSIAIAAGGVNMVVVDRGGTNTISLNAPTLHADGAVGGPAISFVADSDTGFYRDGTNSLAITTGGTYRGAFNTLTFPLRLQFLGQDGTAALPGHSFESDPDTGIYRVGANEGRLGAGAGLIAWWNTQGFGVIDGTALLPGYHFVNDTNTGIYRSASDDFSLVAGGAAILSVNTTRVDLNQGVLRAPDGTSANPPFTFFNDPDNGLYRAGTNQPAIAANGIRAVFWDGTAAGQMYITTDGTTSLPAYSFSNDADTGLIRNGANTLEIIAGTVRTFQFNASVLIPLQVILTNVDGSNTNPTYSFNSDPDTGMYRGGVDNLRLATGGVKALEIDSSQNLFDKNNIRLGYLSVPRSTTATTLAIGDVGKCVAITAAIAIPVSVFAAGDCISIYNDSAGALNITIAGGTLRLAGTATTGTRSLAARGIATLWFNVGGATPEVIASGSVS